MMRGLLNRELGVDQPETDTTVQIVDLTPMLDVVFILLIFFMVTASFVKLPGIEVERSVAATAELRKPALLVAIDRSGGIWIDKTLIDEHKLKFHLARLLAENPRGGLVVQVDNNARVAQLALVTEIAEQLGISDISVSTLHK